MAVSYASIKNKGGMSAQVVACAYGDSSEENANGAHSNGRKTLYSLDIAGAHTAVKAIWASVLGGSPLTPAGFARYKVLRADKEVGYALFKRMPLPNIHHYHLVVEPAVTAPYAVITSRYGLSREDALACLLDAHTLYPVIPQWGDVLFAEGSRHKLIHPLETFGMAWAYRIDLLAGWDEVFDRAAKERRLAFPQAA